MIIKKKPCRKCGRASFCLEFAGKMKEVLHKSESSKKKEDMAGEKFIKKKY